MTATQIGSMVDVAIPAVIGLLIILGRRGMVAKIIDPEKRARTQKLLGLAGPILLMSAALIGVSTIGSFKKRDPLADAVAIINSKAPRMIDEITRLEGATAEDGRRLVCRATFTTYTSQAIDKKVWEEQVVPVIRERMNAIPAIEAARKEGITTVYRYSGSDGVVIGEVVFEADRK